MYHSHGKTSRTKIDGDAVRTGRRWVPLFATQRLNLTSATESTSFNKLSAAVEKKEIAKIME